MDPCASARSARLTSASAAAARSPSTASTGHRSPGCPTRRRRARHRRRGRPGAHRAVGSTSPITASTRTSAAPGWTCQKPPAETCHRRPAAASSRCSRPRPEPTTTTRSPVAGETVTDTCSTPGQDVPRDLGDVDQRVRDQTVVDRRRRRASDAGETPLARRGRRRTAPACASAGRRESFGRLSRTGTGSTCTGPRDSRPVDPSEPGQLLGHHGRLEPPLLAERRRAGSRTRRRHRRTRTVACTRAGDAVDQPPRLGAQVATFGSDLGDLAPRRRSSGSTCRTNSTCPSWRATQWPP